MEPTLPNFNFVIDQNKNKRKKERTYQEVLNIYPKQLRSSKTSANKRTRGLPNCNKSSTD
jgi:hypothetical protein